MKMKNHKRIINLLTAVLITAGIFFSPAYPGYAQSDQVWTEPVNLSNSGSSTDPSLVIDSKGVMHVIWVDKFDGYKYVKSDDGVSWTSPVKVKFPFSPERDSRPVFLADESGEIHALWRDARGALNHTRFLSSRFDQPSTWAGIIRLAGSVADFDAMSASRGVVHLGYISNLGSDVEPAGVYYRRLSGGNWSSAKSMYGSQYFRSLEPADSNIRLAVSKESDNVYMVWDDRSQKRIFMTRSANGGGAWEGVAQIKGPEDTSSLELPYNINIGVISNKPILLWQVGIPGGNNCTQYSQSALDEGNQFGAPIKLTDKFTACPQRVDFILQSSNFSVALLNIQDNPSLIAWNGSTWSDLQVQNEISTFTSPVTLESVSFGCKKFSIYEESLLAVGCDEGGNGDIWFRSRSLGSLDDWFPPPSAWSPATELTNVGQAISSLSSIADGVNNAHALWVQSASSGGAPYAPRILYARWNGTTWSNPAPIIGGVSGMPVDLSVAIDTQQRLLLSWVDENSGDVLFSWANSSRANFPVEWMTPVVFSSPSALNSSPHILVDASNRIVVVYAVTMNEGRGIYLVESNDRGNTWTAPRKIFDAVVANWDMVDHPQLALTRDGNLHLLFTRLSPLSGGQSIGLYYSWSGNGGFTWSDPEVVSQQNVLWSSILADNGQTLHRLWQEKARDVVLINHQVSRDGGTTWETTVRVSSTEGGTPAPALSIDGLGYLYLVQVLNDDTRPLREWEWAGERWHALEAASLTLEEQSIPLSIQSGITSNGVFYALLLTGRNDLLDGNESRLLSVHRIPGAVESSRLVSSAVIAMPQLLDATQEPPAVLLPTDTPTSPLVDAEPPSSTGRNIIGLALIGAVTLALLIFILPGRNRR
jgi:hypothetical protein